MSDVSKLSRGRRRCAAVLVAALIAAPAMLCDGGAARAQTPDVIGKTVLATSSLADSPFAGPIVDYVYFQSSTAAIHAAVFETSRRAARGGRYRVTRPDAEPRWQLMATREDQPAITVWF